VVFILLGTAQSMVAIDSSLVKTIMALNQRSSVKVLDQSQWALSVLKSHTK